MIDLHTHSTASDGDLSPRELILLAVKRNLKAIAVTDHDTLSGLDEAELTAEETGIRFIPGIELEAPFSFGEFHILGLNLVNRAKIEDRIEALKLKRKNRNLSILRKMNDSGIEAKYEDIGKYAKGLIGRPHFAKYLIERGIVSSLQEAFDRFLGKGQPFYIPKDTLPIDEIVDIIKEGGGRAVIAHPQSLRLSLEELAALLPAWKEMGIDGLEAFHPRAKPSYCKKLEKLARLKGFFITAGSDFHGFSRPERRLGKTTSKQKTIPDHFLKELLSAPEYSL